MPHVNRFNHTLQESIVAAVAESVGVLDRRIGKVTLQRALEKLRKDKVGRGEFDKMKTAIRKTKADHKALVVDVDKKATKAELKRLRDAVYTGGTLSPSNSLHSPTQSITDDPSIDSLSEMQGEGEDGYFGGLGAQQYFDRKMQQQGMGTAGGAAAVVDAASAAALNDLTMRLDLLVKQFKDVTDVTLPTLVPREEVHEALQAVLHEIKLVKLNTINVNRFKQGLDTKADAEEVKRLVETLNHAVGDMMGTNVAAAGKLRCLLCDKPVGSVVKDVEKRDRGRSLSPQSHGPHSVADESPNYRPGSSSSSVGTGANRGSPSKLEHAKQARITSELSVLRNSIDLPLMDPSIAQSQQSSVSQPKDMYKQRIRASGGGGFGANYTENTR